MATTDLSMLKGLQSGDDQKRNKFAVAFYAPLLERGRRAGLSVEDAEDVAQDVLIAVIAAAKTFDRDTLKSFTNWVAAFANRRIHERIRAAARRARRERSYSLQQGERAGPGEEDGLTAFAHELLERSLKRVQGRCPDKIWTMYLASELEGRPAVEVATALGVNPQQIFDARSRVRKLLREVGAELLQD